MQHAPSPYIRQIHFVLKGLIQKLEAVYQSPWCNLENLNFHYNIFLDISEIQLNLRKSFSNSSSQ
jgi:hypothetical protein